MIDHFHIMIWSSSFDKIIYGIKFCTGSKF